MYRALKNAALCAALISSTGPVSAAMHMRISDGTLSGTIVVSDQGPDDSNPDLGVVSYTGPVGSQWVITVTTGTSKPFLGSAAEPRIDLNSFNVSSISGGMLFVELTDTDFTGSGPATVAIGGTTQGTVMLKTFVDPDNLPFNQTTLVASQGPFSTSSFANNAAAVVSMPGPFSVTFELQISHAGSGTTGLDAELNIVPPSYSCPSNVTVRCGSSLDPEVNQALGKPIYSTSNCGPATITYSDAITATAPCSRKIVRTWTIIDACNITNTCTQEITVFEDVAPMLVVPSDVSVECSAVPPVGNATATDACDTNVVVHYLGEIRIDGQKPACAYTLVRTWKATDSCGNMVTNRQTILVHDTTPPVLTVPGPVTIECSATLPNGNATATDNCGSATVTFLGQSTNGSGCTYTIKRTWKAADACGNAVTNSQIITVRDTTPPVIVSVPPGGEIGCTAPPSVATIRGQVTATDNCRPVTINVTFLDSGTACSSNRTFTITATDGCNTSAVRTVVFTMNCAPCVASTFNFTGSTALYGTAGNIRTYTVNGVSVKASAFSRNKSSGAWSTAYLGAYGGGLGVTDGSEGTGGNNSHTVDNIDRENYVLFEFSQPVVLNRAFLGYVVSDSDLSVWIGNFADPFNNHLVLNDAVLGSFGHTEEDITDLSTTRWADLNSSEVVGNAIIIAAWRGDTTPEDQFKIEKLDLCVRVCEPVCKASICGTVLRDCDADGSLSGESGLSGWTVTLKNNAGTVTLATTTTDASGNYCFTNLPGGSYRVVVSPMPSHTQTYDFDGTKDNVACVTIADCENKSGVKFGYTGTAADVYLVVKGPVTAQCGDTITYTFAVTNTGNTCLYGGMVVNSPLLGGQIFHQTPVNPGQGFVFTKTYVVKTSDAGTLVNTATVIGDPPGSLANVTRTVSMSTAVTCTPPSQGCTYTIGYYKNHASAIAPLPILLGTSGGAKTLAVTSQQIGVSVLGQHTYGAPNNGITKLYAQLLAAKLNILGGASSSAAASAINSADAFLATHNHLDWGSLTTAEQNSVLAWHSTLDKYNNGLIGPGHCDDKECDRTLTLTATSGAKQVHLAWTPSRAATGYIVARSRTPGGPYITLKSGLTATNYTDTAVANGTPYYYVVKATKNGADAADSDEVCGIPCVDLPSPWATKDIGSVDMAGAANYASGVGTISGSGRDIWDSSDEFRYGYLLASGDCSIIARVNGVQDTHSWAKAGVMIRETLDTGSKHAFMCVTPGNGVAFQSRSATGGASANVNTTGLTAPYWVRLVRAGNVFTGYASPNGTTWTKIGETTISMGTSVYIGLGVTSHNDGVLCTATFQNITATP